MNQNTYPENTSEVILDDEYYKLMRVEDNEFREGFRAKKLYLEGTGIAFAVVGAGTGVARETTAITEAHQDVANGVEGVFVANNIALGLATVAIAGVYGLRSTWRRRHLRSAAQRMDTLLSSDKTTPNPTVGRE